MKTYSIQKFFDYHLERTLERGLTEQEAKEKVYKLRDKEFSGLIQYEIKEDVYKHKENT